MFCSFGDAKFCSIPPGVRLDIHHTFLHELTFFFLKIKIDNKEQTLMSPSIQCVNKIKKILSVSYTKWFIKTKTKAKQRIKLSSPQLIFHLLLFSQLFPLTNLPVTEKNIYQKKSIDRLKGKVRKTKGERTKVRKRPVFG